MSINITGGSTLPTDTTDALIASTGANTENRFATLSDVGGAGLEVLPLIGGTMSGNIAWSAGGQFIGVGLDDFGLGGAAGLSQVCSVGYDLNWQAGWLTAYEQNRTTTRPLFLNSGYGTSLKVWDYNANTGTEISHSYISTSGEGATITHNNGSFNTYTLNGADLTFNTQAYYEVPSNMQISILGLTFPDGSFQGTAAGAGFVGAKKTFSGRVGNGTNLSYQDFAIWALLNSGGGVDEIGSITGTVKYTIILEYDVFGATITSSPAGTFGISEGYYSNISTGGFSNGWTLDNSVGETYTYVGGSDKKVILKFEITTNTASTGWSPVTSFEISTDAGSVDYTVYATIIAEKIA